MEITLQTNKTYLVQKVIPVVEKRGLEPLDEVLLVSWHRQTLKHRIRCSQALASHVRGKQTPTKTAYIINRFNQRQSYLAFQGGFEVSNFPTGVIWTGHRVDKYLIFLKRHKKVYFLGQFYMIPVNKSFCFHMEVAILCSLVQPYSDLAELADRQQNNSSGSETATAQAQDSGYSNPVLWGYKSRVYGFLFNKFCQRNFKELRNVMQI